MVWRKASLKTTDKCDAQIKVNILYYTGKGWRQTKLFDYIQIKTRFTNTHLTLLPEHNSLLRLYLLTGVKVFIPSVFMGVSAASSGEKVIADDGRCERELHQYLLRLGILKGHLICETRGCLQMQRGQLPLKIGHMGQISFLWVCVNPFEDVTV